MQVFSSEFCDILLEQLFFFQNTSRQLILLIKREAVKATVMQIIFCLKLDEDDAMFLKVT